MLNRLRKSVFGALVALNLVLLTAAFAPAEKKSGIFLIDGIFDCCQGAHYCCQNCCWVTADCFGHGDCLEV